MAKRKRRQPAALARYWASHRRHRRNPSRRRHHYAAAAPRRHHRRRNRTSYNPRRRRNPGLRGLASRFTSGSTLKMIAGGAIGFFGARFIPQNVGMLAQYNTGVTGYLLNAGSGLAVSYLASKFLGREFLTGGLIGTGLAVISRMVTDSGPGTATGTAMQGDLDFDLGYYLDDPWPFDRTTWGSAGGPYATFPGNPRGVAALPTAASAVRAGATAAAAVPSLPGAYPGGGGYGAPGGWRGSGRWMSR